MRTALLLFLSHAAALTFGWAMYSGDLEAPAPIKKPEREPGTASDTDPRLLGELHERWNIAAEIGRQKQMMEARAVAREMDPQAMIAEANQQQADELRRKKDAILERSKAVVLPSDPAAELSRLLALTEPQNHHGWVHPDHRPPSAVEAENQFFETYAFAVAWLTADPSAALAFLESDAAKGANDLTMALETWIEGVGIRKANDHLSAAPQWWKKLSSQLMSNAMRSDPRFLDKLLESLEPVAGRETLIKAAVSGLAEPDRDAALAWILASLEGKEAGLAAITLAINIHDKPAARKILEEIEPQLDPAAVIYMKSWGNYGDIMRSIGPDSSLEQRVDAALAGGVIGKTDGEKRANATRGIIYQDLSAGIHEAELRVPLEIGTIGAAKLWEHASHAFPTYAQQVQPTLLEAVFMASVPHDPDGAIALLETHEATDRLPDLAVQALDNWFDRDIESAIELIHRLPQEVIREHLPEFDDGFRKIVRRNAYSHGSFWFDWVEAQPPGLTKDLLLRHSATHASQAGNKSLASDLSSQIQDDEIRNLSQP